MRNTYILLAFFLIFTPITNAQIRLKPELNKLDTLPDWYKNSTQKPPYALKGTQLLIETDTIYVINALRYHYYQNLQDLKEMVEKNNTPGLALEIIKNYERALDSCRGYYALLLKNAEKTDAISNAFLEKTKETVESAKNTLKLADERLGSADKKLTDADVKLDEARKLIKKSRMKTILQKIAIGAGCLLIGFAVGK
jgi:hypothetical protein